MVKTPKKELSALEKLAARILRKNAQIKAYQAELEVMKEEAKGLLAEKTTDFVEGKLTLSNAIISIALNPPKLVNDANGKSLEKEDRLKFAAKLDAKYVVRDVDIPLLLNQSWSDATLKRLLKNERIRVEQTSRYDVKPLPKK